MSDANRSIPIKNDRSTNAEPAGDAQFQMHRAMGTGAEFDSIRELIEVWGDAAEGIGDDAAVRAVPPSAKVVISTDACVENVHFWRTWITAEEVGQRAASAALSDLAAMGAHADSLLIAFIAPENWRHDLVHVARGIASVAKAVGARIVGGNISSGQTFSCTITVLGYASRPVSRKGARAGDVLMITGTLGGPSSAVRDLYQGRAPNPQARERFVRPAPRVREGLWLAEHGVRAMIDVSDGLAADARHLAAASNLSASIDSASIPRFAFASPQEALTGGEEYELLVAVAPDHANALAAEFVAEFGLPLTEVGTLGNLPDTATDHDSTGQRVEFSRGHDHFSR